MSGTTTAMNQHADQTVEELKALIREAESALAQAGSNAGEEVENLRDRLRDAYAEGKEGLGRAAELARKQAAKADELVRANPYASIGIATAAGLVLGLLIARPWASR